MNQVLLTRLFRSIDADANSPLIKVAYSIIEDEKKKGHSRVAKSLTAILENNLAKPPSKSFKVIRDKEYEIPRDRRYKLPLATHVEHEYLRHEMVLSGELESKIHRIEQEYIGSERLLHYGLKPRKKILFYGSSGCGKSMAAERIAWNLGLPFYKVRFDSIISSYLGESASNLQKLFESIENYPCVLLLDEFDIIGKQRNFTNNDVGEIHRIVNIILGLLEEYDGQGIIIATTNLEGSLDNALYRRFDDIIELPKPEKKEIKLLLKMTFSALTLDPKIILEHYAEKMQGLSYAIIEKTANDAAKNAVINAKTEISKKDLDKALEENRIFNS